MIMFQPLPTAFQRYDNYAYQRCSNTLPAPFQRGVLPIPILRIGRRRERTAYCVDARPYPSLFPGGGDCFRQRPAKGLTYSAFPAIYPQINPHDLRWNMPAISPKVPPSTPSNAPRHGWSLPVRILDRRSREWKRRAEIIETLAAQFDASQVTDGLRRQIEAAAELLTIAELARARYLAGEGVSLDDVVRVERAAGLAEKRLAQHRQKPAKPNLSAYLAAKAAA